MAVLRPRNRVVYFRLSQEEFHKLATLSETTEGAGSVSELSRSAVRKFLNGEGDNGGDLTEIVKRMGKNVDVLNQKVEHLIELLRAREAGQPRANGEASAVQADAQAAHDGNSSND
jgi:hypothetical protein